MSTVTWRIPGRNTNVTFKGYLDFAQCSPHKPYKSEYGLDAMSVAYKGAVIYLHKFLDTLFQGKRIDHNNKKWFLQTWEVDDNNIWPTVTLNCIGLVEGKFPVPKGDDTYITQNITVDAEVDDVQVSRSIEYRCLQTTWEYVVEGRPKAVKVGKVSRPVGVDIISSRITAGDTTYSGANAPAAYVTATTPALVDFVLSLDAVSIPGTPYFHCQEVVARMYVAG